MSYITPFQSIALFENTFKHQINKESGKVEHRDFVFNKHFGDGVENLPVKPDKYRLIWMPGCPHSNKAVIVLRLLGLDRVISIGECGILRDPRGWVFSEDIGEVDPVLKIHYLDDAYLKGDPDFIGRSTVPAIIDISSGAVVQNEAWDIPRYLICDWKKYHKENAPDLYPEDKREEIDELTEFIKDKVNAYACGFARNQKQYDYGYKMFFDALDTLEERLVTRRFLLGDYISLADVHLYVALIRFHINYHLVFGVNKKRLEDYPNLWAYTKEIFQTEGFNEYTKLEQIKKHYQLSPHMRAKQGNINGLIGTGPDYIKLYEKTDRYKLSNDSDNKYIYEENVDKLFAHNNVEVEKEYLIKYLIDPVNNAKKATYQNELERWGAIERDTIISIDKRLKDNDYLLGDKVSEADIVLYQSLKRHDYIYYYLYKLNSFKSFDYENVDRYIKCLDNNEEVRNTI